MICIALLSCRDMSHSLVAFFIREYYEQQTGYILY